MKFLNVCFLATAFLCFNVQFVHSQTIKPIAEIELGNNITSFNTHPTTGAQIIFTAKEILGLDPCAKEINWRVSRSGMNAIADS